MMDRKTKRNIASAATVITLIAMFIGVVLLDEKFVQHKNQKQAEVLAPYLGPKNTMVGPHLVGCLEGKTSVRVGTGTGDTYFYRLTPEGKTIPCQ
jgi:hypothetical protein